VSDSSFFQSNAEFRDFLNTNKGFYNIDVPNIISPQYAKNPFNYFSESDDDSDPINPKLNKALFKVGGTQNELDFLHKYIGFEDNIRQSKKQLDAASQGVSNLISKSINSKEPNIWFTPEETLYRGSRVPADTKSPNIGDTVEFKRFRSTSPDPQLAIKFSKTSGESYLDLDLANERFGKGNQGRFEVIEPLHGGLKLGNPFDGEDQEVLLKPAKFEVIDKKLFKPDYRDAIEFLKYKQFFNSDPVTAGIQGAGEMIRSAPRGIAGGAALSALSPDVAQSVEQGQYGKAATQAAQSVVGGAATDLAIQAAGQGLQRVAPQLAGRVIPAFGGVANVAVPAAVGAGLFMQGKQGSPLNTIVNKAANVVPGLRSNPKTDVGRMAGQAIGNEAQYAWNQIRKGRIPWMGR